MSISRRRFLAAGGTAAAAGLAAPALGAWPRPELAWAAGCSEPMRDPSPALHLLSRASFGPSRSELARLERMGASAWLEEQLAWESIDDRAVDAALAPLESLGWSAAQIKSGQGRPIANELIAATLYRAVASRRQLYEVMVDLWSNHFNVWHPEELVARTKTIDDREVFRKHALGSFRDLAQGSSASPSMMRYLNTVRNTRQGPNENFARELMELHVLGVDGGYTEADVKQVALCFTGWNIRGEDWTWEFRSAEHALGSKVVLGKRIPEAGADEGRMVIDHLVDQPACARHVARKLCRRFVADAPPDALVAQVAAAFGRDGDIRAMLRVLFGSTAFAEAWRLPAGGGAWQPAKIRRPIEHWAGAMRALEIDAGALLRELPQDAYEQQDLALDGRAEFWLQRMDQLPFRWPSPDGYPDRGDWWSGMHVLLGRWNYAFELCDGRLWGIQPELLHQMKRDGVPSTPAEVVDYWSARTVFRPLSIVDRQRLILMLSGGDAGPLPDSLLQQRLPLLVALLFDSPYFEWR